MELSAALLLALAVCVGVGYALKGAAGFGEMLPLVAVGQIMAGRADLVVVATVLSLLGGLVALAGLRRQVRLRALVADVRLLATGSVGGVTLAALGPTVLVDVLFAGTLLTAALALLVVAFRPAGGRVAIAGAGNGSGAVATSAAVPWIGRAGVVTAGVTGGIAGVDGPPLAASLAARGGDFRPALVALLVVSSSMRLGLLAVSGSLGAAPAVTALLLVPVAAFGYGLGRRYGRGLAPGTAVRIAAAVAVTGSLLAVAGA